MRQWCPVPGVKVTVAFAHDVGVLSLWTFGDQWLHFVPVDEQVLFVLVALQFHIRRCCFGVEEFLSCAVRQFVVQATSGQICNQFLKLGCWISVASHGHALFWGSHPLLLILLCDMHSPLGDVSRVKFRWEVHCVDVWPDEHHSHIALSGGMMQCELWVIGFS